ncbi:DUF1294 domain-containing protein [Paeniclostridium hominis]|uniref:DUF1294 domain-containing protein n=1 Tax=Paeniclostridium hominis TaxID=2764329 RepID=UPI001654EB86|nr:MULTISPECIES: DUF1294 domain-containing protein [Paeniclostridium]MBC8630384.1 DUF1294 domain-containing protein [[Eubacterium] tenue]MDU1538494.1 DUF1294 domain-containing protein [Paeniclostridium sordellii]
MKFLTLYFIIMSIITFLLMYIDKNRAIKGQWRIPEATLINLSILGGGIGTYMGMYIFRHKTRHPKFTIFIPITIILNLFLYYILLKFII